MSFLLLSWGQNKKLELYDNFNRFQLPLLALHLLIQPQVEHHRLLPALPALEVSIIIMSNISSITTLIFKNMILKTTWIALSYLYLISIHRQKYWMWRKMTKRFSLNFRQSSFWQVGVQDCHRWTSAFAQWGKHHQCQPQHPHRHGPR